MDGRFPYYRSSKNLPKPMLERLSGEYQLALDPQNLLLPDDVHTATLRLARRYARDYEMVAPPLNTALYLHRYMEELALPLEVYAATRRLERIAKANIAFPTGEQGRSNIALRYPEVQLVSLIVVATKLLFPFDDIERNPTAATELSALSVQWKDWVAERKNTDDEPGHLTYGKAFSVTDSDIISMTESSLDQYLEWYAQTLATEGTGEDSRASQDADFKRAMFDMFPVHEERSETSNPISNREQERSARRARLKSAQASVKARRIVLEQPTGNADVSRPGMFYRRYRKPEELSGPVKVFYKAAACLAGISMDSIVKAVFLTERKLQKWAEDVHEVP